MDGYTTYYDKCTTIKHEDTLHLYNTLFKQQLNLQQHIKLALHQDNYNLVNYLISKRVAYLKNLIDKKTAKYGFILIYFVEGDERPCFGQQMYELRLIYYNKLASITQNVDVNCVKVEYVIDKIAEEEDWEMLWSLYVNEKTKIINFAKQEDKIL